MSCKNCESNFRTIHLKKGQRMICYKCGFDNGIKETEEGESGLE